MCSQEDCSKSDLEEASGFAEEVEQTKSQPTPRPNQGTMGCSTGRDVVISRVCYDMEVATLAKCSAS